MPRDVLLFVVIFGLLWLIFFIDEEVKHGARVKYERTLKNIKRLEKWHGENP